MENERELRLSIKEIQSLLKKGKLIKDKEVVYEIRIEPGELVIRLIK